jgi:hypothetical protein
LQALLPLSPFGVFRAIARRSQSNAVGAGAGCAEYSVHVAVTGSTFDVKNWKGEGGDDYTLSVNAGQ